MLSILINPYIVNFPSTISIFIKFISKLHKNITNFKTSSVFLLKIEMFDSFINKFT